MFLCGYELKGKLIYMSVDIVGCLVYFICVLGVWEWFFEFNMWIYFFLVGGFYDGCKKIIDLFSVMFKLDRYIWNFVILELDEIRNLS